MSHDQVPDRDSAQNEDPETVAGAVGGVTGIGAGAGLGLSVLGPVGAVIGALAGAVGGWWTGKGVLNAVEDVDRADSQFRRAHEHAGATGPYDEERHSYQLGYLAGRNPQYADTTFAEIEDDLRGAWIEAHLHDRDPVPWENVRTAVIAGYELARKEG
ncbi:MAG: hypothetical protein WD766_06880 [Gemmatimonadota bacterium]